ncbi:MAG: hypothetical protein AAF587_27655 [Bacteroidota bacterium]
MKRLPFIFTAVSLLVLVGMSSGFVPSDGFVDGLRVFKLKKKGIVIGPSLNSAKGSYCCTFSDGTKCYSSDCSFCGCSGTTLAELKQKKDALQVRINPKGDINVKHPSAAGTDEGGSYCCTFSDGTKCYSSDCSFCGCN